METVKVSCTVRRVPPNTAIIDIAGEVNGQAEKMLLDAYADASTGDTRAVILNFSRLIYMNSSGIGLLVTILIRAQRIKQRLMAYGLTEHYVEIFELTRLNEVIHLYAGEAEALNAAVVVQQ